METVSYFRTLCDVRPFARLVRTRARAFNSDENARRAFTLPERDTRLLVGHDQGAQSGIGRRAW